MKPKDRKYILENISRKSAGQIAQELNLKERSVARFAEQYLKQTKSAPAPLPPQATNISKQSVIFSILILACACILTYVNCLKNQWVWDDMLLIVQNKHIESFSYLSKVFSEDLFHMAEKTGYYRPMQVISYMVDYLFWGRNPVGYHLTGVAIQLLNSLIVFYLNLFFFRNPWKSLSVALLFCVHPAFVPIVLYVSGRADLLGFLFGMGSVCFALHGFNKVTSKFSSWLSVIAYALAILSKEYYFIMPLLIGFYILIFRRELSNVRATRFYWLGIACVAGAYLVLRSTLLNFHQDMGVISKQPFSTRLQLFPYILTNYVFGLILPVNLAMEKKLVYSSLMEPRFVLSYLTPLTIGWVIYYFYRCKHRLSLFFLGWFLIAIIPLTHVLVPLKAIMADHWTYLASVGFFSLIVLVIDEWLGCLPTRYYPRRVGMACLAVCVLFYARTTIQENHVWKNEDVLFAEILKRSPEDSKTIFNIGKLWEGKGDSKKALEYYNRAIGLASHDGFYLWNRGHLFRKLGQSLKALDDFQAAVKADPANIKFLNDLGGIYAELGRTAEARAEWEEVLRLDPQNEFTKKNLDVISDSSNR